MVIQRSEYLDNAFGSKNIFVDIISNYLFIRNTPGAPQVSVDSEIFKNLYYYINTSG